MCSDELQWQLFGEIHMLSHLVGASRRSDLARVHELEVTCAARDGKLAQLKHDHRAALKERKRLEDELASRRREGDLSERRLTIAHRKIEDLESQAYVGELQARVAEMEEQLREAQGRASRAEASLPDSEAMIQELREVRTHAIEQVRELTAENEALESELTVRMICPFAEGQEHDGDDDVGGLSGKRILCVGGRIGLVQHYRALVERRGGEFLHHDGGLEDSMDAVTRALSSVDVVVCPVDCVSHAASLKVKKACKHLATQLVPLRSSGLSSVEVQT
jgi:predicted  nucleic acid-binding Zn-ribbon protein